MGSDMRNLNKSTWIKIASATGVVILGFLAMSSLGSTEKHSKQRDVPPEIRLVETESVNFSDIVLEIKLCVGSDRDCTSSKK
jgi:hypothetical protein